MLCHTIPQLLTMSSANLVLSINDWQVPAFKFMAPKTNDKGGKSINIISKQTNRSLHISTPLMMTWGISDFVVDGESDGKYSMSLNFPNDEYRNAQTDAFLQKLKDFENVILDEAVKNSEMWWGGEMTRDMCKYGFFPFLKYSKIKDSMKIDHSKPPSIRGKVPFYNGKWNVEIYDTKSNLIFPCDKDHDHQLTPIDFVPKLSSVACVLQCGGIWIGGKGWGLTWKMIQCIVKPREVVSVYGKCQIQLSAEDRDFIDKQVVPEEESDEVVESVVKAPPVPVVSTQFNTTVIDSDDEEPQKTPVKELVPEHEQPVIAVKKVIKKAPTPEPVVVEPVVVTPVVVTPVSVVAPVAVKKLVVKKKTVVV